MERDPSKEGLFSNRSISIHALRMERDPEGPGVWSQIQKISIHALRMERDGYDCGCRHRRRISIHALRMERDAKVKLLN